MITVSILQYDHEDHQFCPCFVTHNDLRDSDNECSFDEVIIQPSEAWMTDYLEWNRWGRLPDDPEEDWPDEDDPSCGGIPIFQSVQELHEFNAQGHNLTQRLRAELEQNRRNNSCAIQVAPFAPIYSNLVVGPVSAWWHVKDLNYGFVVPVQRLPVSDQLKSRLQAFRCHKGMEFWKLNDPDTMAQLQREGRELQNDVRKELHYAPEVDEEDNLEDATVQRLEACKIGGTVVQSGSRGVSPVFVEMAARIPLEQSRVQ